MSLVTIDHFINPTKTPTQLIGGTKSADVTEIAVNGQADAAFFLSATEWAAIVAFSPGLNTVEMVPTILTGDVGAPVTIQIQAPTFKQTLFSPFGTLDEHGVPFNLERLPGEKNVRYRNRLLDVYTHKGGANYLGLIHAVARELSLKPYFDVLRLKVDLNTQGIPLATTPAVIIDDVSIKLFWDQRQSPVERIVVDPGLLRHTLAEAIRPGSKLLLTNEQGSEISPLRYQVEFATREVRFEESLAGQVLFAHYRGAFEITRSGKTIADVVAEIPDPFTLEVDDTTVNTLPADWITKIEFTDITAGVDPPEEVSINEPGIRLTVSSVVVRALHEVRDSLLNDRRAAYDTPIQGWVEQILALAHLKWGTTILGQDTWNTKEGQTLLAALPHLTDPLRGFWQAPGNPERFDFHQARGLGFKLPDGTVDLVFAGLAGTDFQSGTSQAQGMRTTFAVQPNVPFEKHLEDARAGGESLVEEPGLQDESVVGFGVNYGSLYPAL